MKPPPRSQYSCFPSPSDSRTDRSTREFEARTCHQQTGTPDCPRQPGKFCPGECRLSFPCSFSSPLALGLLSARASQVVLRKSYRRLKKGRFNPRLGRSPGRGHDDPLQYSCLENPMDRGAWWAAYSPGVRKESDTTERLST